MAELILKGYESDNDTNTYTVEGQRVIVSNDGASAIKVKINNIEVDVLAGEVLGPEELSFGRFQSVKVTATATAYRLFIYEDG
jgi:hypothetical protein